MGEARKFNTSFLGGEVSDRFMARIDTPLYDRTLRILENLIIHPAGGLDFDPGTEFICEAKTNTDPVRLLPFEKSSSEKYVLELTELACRFYKDKARVMDGGNPLETATPWLKTDLFGLQTAQQENKLYLAHGSYQLQGLTCFGEKSWALSSADLDVSLAVIFVTTSPYFQTFSYSNDIFSKRPDATAPAGQPTGIALTPDGNYLVIGHYTTPYISIYKRSGDGYIKLSNPAQLPTSDVTDVSFSGDGIYLAVSMGLTPFMALYKRSGDIFTKLSNPADLPAATATLVRCQFSDDGVYLIYTSDVSPYAFIYKRNGDSFSKIANPFDVAPTGTCGRASFSPGGDYLAIGLGASPYLLLYKRNGDSFIKLANPATMPAGGGGACFSYDGQYLAFVESVSPYILIYRRSRDSFSKLSDPAVLPTGAASGAAFSRDNTYLAVAHTTTPFLTIYKRSANTFVKLAGTPVLPNNGTLPMFVRDGWENVVWGSKYPKALTFHDQRLVLARNGIIRGSRIGWPQDFTLEPADASYGFEYSLAGDTLEEIIWMRTKAHNIVVGTTLGEWLLTGGDAPITGANVFADRVSGNGSAEICAVLANASLLYVQKGGQRLLEFLYSQERGGYVSPDLTLLADHIGEAGFAELAWQRSPSSMLWTRLGTGELTSLTLDRNNSIVAWGRHPRDGVLKSLAIVSGDASNGEDTIYLCMQRVINGVTKQYIEVMHPQRRPADEKNYHFVDCGKIFDYSATQDSMTGATKANPVVVTAGAHPFVNDDKIRITGVVGMTELNGNVYTVKNKAADTFELYDEPGTTPVNGLAFGTYVSGGLVEKVVKVLSGLSHLEAKTVAVYADGVELGQEVVAAGAITIDQYAAKIHVGLPYTGKMWTQRLGHFSPIRISEATLLLSKSRGGKIGSDVASLKPIRYDTVDLKTGAQRVTIGGRFSDEGSIMIVQDQPLPMSILGIVGKLSIGE